MALDYSSSVSEADLPVVPQIFLGCERHAAGSAWKPMCPIGNFNKAFVPEVAVVRYAFPSNV